MRHLIIVGLLWCTAVSVPAHVCAQEHASKKTRTRLEEKRQRRAQKARFVMSHLAALLSFGLLPITLPRTDSAER